MRGLCVDVDAPTLVAPVACSKTALRAEPNNAGAYSANLRSLTDSRAVSHVPADMRAAFSIQLCLLVSAVALGCIQPSKDDEAQCPDVEGTYTMQPDSGRTCGNITDEDWNCVARQDQECWINVHCDDVFHINGELVVIEEPDFVGVVPGKARLQLDSIAMNDELYDVSLTFKYTESVTQSAIRDAELIFTRSAGAGACAFELEP